MKNSSKFSILDVLNDYFNKNEETKVSWDPLHEAATEKFKEGNELTDEAKREATERSFDVSVYKTILTYLKHSGYDNFQNKIAREYEKGKFDQDKFFKEKNINRLASAYENHKEDILVEKLLLLNPGGEFTEVKEKKVVAR